MKIYVICPKTSSNEEVAKEFSEGYGWDNIDLAHVRSNRTDLVEIQQDLDRMDKKQDFEIRTLIISVS